MPCTSKKIGNHSAMPPKKPFTLVGGSPPSNKAGKAAEASSPASGAEPKTFDVIVNVNAPECFARMPHSFVTDEPIRVMNRAKRNAVFAQVGCLHDRTEWDPVTRKAGPKAKYKAKYGGLCSLDPDGSLNTGVPEFVDYVQKHIIEPNASLWDSGTYFFKATPTAPPTKYESIQSYTEFQARVNAHEFAYATPDVLTRLARIENHLFQES